MKRFRRRFALPTLIATLAAAWFGMTAHALGYWSILGTLSDGRYVVSTATFVIAGVLCGAPVLGPGLVLYVLARARLRRAWQSEHRRNGVSKEWLEENAPRFG